MTEPSPAALHPLPALYGYCEQIFKEMDKEAQDFPEGRIYEGSLTKLVASTGLSNPYYTSVMRALKAMDCVRQLRRGGGGHGSQWAIMQPPSHALWRSHAEPVLKEDSPKDQAADQRIKDVWEYIRTLERRVERLEAQVA
jgi:hypothetical protein